MRFLSVLLAFSTISVFGAKTVDTFQCQSTRAMYDGKKHTIVFKIENLFSGELSLAADPKEETDIFLKVTPKNSKFDALRENWGIRRKSDRIVWTGDSDGFYDVELALFQKTGYRGGYIKFADHGEGIGDSYSPIRCTISN